MLLRARIQSQIEDGGVPCARCPFPILPGQRWDIGHTIDRAIGGTDADGLSPEHARCNRAAGGRLGHQLAGHKVTVKRASGSGPVVERRTW